jgi:hypothetical protein
LDIFISAPSLGQGTLIILAGTFIIESFLASKSAKMGLIIQQAAGGLLFLAGVYILFQGIRSW